MNVRKISQILILCVVAILSFVTLNQGFYVDENGLLGIYRGIYLGQNMFTDSWESLQTGAFLTIPVFSLYYEVLESFLTSIGIGLVLYTRILYVITRTLVAVYLYAVLKKSVYEEGAFATSIFYYMYIVAWRNFSYKSICDFAVILIICFAFRYNEKRKAFYFVLIGIATCVAILAYPTMLVLAIVIGIGIILNMKYHEMPSKCLWAFVITCFACGALFVGYLQFTTGLSEMIAQLKYLGDQDYDYSLPVRIGKMLLSYVAFAVIAFMPIVAMGIYKKFRQLSVAVEYVLLAIYWLVFFVAICLLRIDGISTSRFVYGLLLVFFWFPYLVYDRSESEYTTIGSYGFGRIRDKAILWMMYVLSIVVQMIWAISTNQEISVPGHMCVYGVMAVILYIYSMDNYPKLLVHILLVVSLFFLAYWMPESNGGFSNVFENRTWVTRGAFMGIALDEEYYAINEDVLALEEQYLTENDKLLVAFGANSSGYLNTNAKIAAHTVFARTQVNTKVLEYWEVNPEKQADYVLIDEGHLKYDDFVAGETGQYIFSTYTNEVGRQGRFVLLGR